MFTDWEDHGLYQNTLDIIEKASEVRGLDPNVYNRLANPEGACMSPSPFEWMTEAFRLLMGFGFTTTPA